MEKLLVEHDVHILYVPKGMTWAVQPLDAGFFKVLKDEVRKVWARDQFHTISSEKEKRRVLIEGLKEVHEIMDGKANIGYWKKAGLEYPNEVQDVIRNNTEQVDEEGGLDSCLEEDGRMQIEEDYSTENLFS